MSAEHSIPVHRPEEVYHSYSIGAEVKALKEEIREGTSAWSDVVSKLTDNIYQGKSKEFVANFATSWIIKTRTALLKESNGNEEIAANAETALTGILKNYLDKASDEDISKLKQYSGILDLLAGEALVKEYQSSPNPVYKTIVEDLSAAKEKTVSAPDRRKKLRLAFASVLATAAGALGLGLAFSTQASAAAEPTKPGATEAYIPPTQARGFTYASTPTPIPSETPTPSATATETPTETETAAPKEPLKINGVDFEKEQNIKMVFSLNDGRKVELSFLSKTLFGKAPTQDEIERFYNEDFAPGAGAGFAVPDKYGNVILALHSGRDVATGRELEAEALRKLFEEEVVRSLEAKFSDNENRQKLNKAEGSSADVITEDGSAGFIIGAVGYIDHSAKPTYDSTPFNDIVDVIADNNRDENGVSKFDIYKGTKRAIIISYCGQGPRDQEKWWVWDRYTIALEALPPQ
ncbi:hypothetical protein A3I55_03900 [Candidatus Woesebacteria bacterium RIFCSPLOWO2_02_FULL_42_10]|nr:MAG: hypothetical protein A3I55_03900 [Candidatus Woesebacteria bacterium RIFCSPLOWO2_02_FULL_42_10]